jgi:multidrug efflux pump subunit AcrA (membrane-fusion protein)
MKARVYSIAPLARGSRWRGDYVATAPVFLKIEEQDPALIPNLTASADVVIQSEPSETIVPREAIFDVQSDGRGVLYVREGSRWRERRVELGLSNHVEAAVRSGVEPGEIVALEQPAS